MNGINLFGSDNIVQGLLTANPTFDTAEFNGPDAKRWRDFCNDELAPLLYPNMSGTWKDSYQSFDYIKQQSQFSSLQKLAIQAVGSFAMYVAATNVKSK
jgi:hypothetical protein